MKRRIVKKWMKRYLEPLVSDLPRTDSYSTDHIEAIYETLIVVKRQHVIVNGKIKSEGSIPFRCNNILLSIKRTAEEIKRIRHTYRYVYLRTWPEVSRRSTYVRLITE